MPTVDRSTPTALPSVPASPAPNARWVTVGLAAAALICTAIGFSGIGDAPDPHASGTEIAAWFTARRSDILHAAPFGYLGALALVGLAAVLAADARRHRRGAAARPRAVLAGGVVTATYLTGAQIGWGANAYLIAGSSADAAKAVFVLTITSVPVLAVGVALLTGAAATQPASWLTRAVWRLVGTAIAVIAPAGVVAIADHGFFSPDVQQQVIGNALLVWLLVTGLTATFPTKSRPLHPHSSQQEAPT